MIKIVQNSAYKWNEPSSVLVPLHSKGVDSNWMVKRAAAGCFTDFIRDLKPIKTATILHALAVGDDETWGENRNGDGFSRADNKTAHEWFKKIGHVFKNHKSSDPALACGEVIKTAHNDDMDRIELLLALDNNKCAKELEHFANGKDIVLSMGCFTAGQKVTLSDWTKKNIESIEVGESVITHTGNSRKVLSTFKYNYADELYTVKARTVEDIICTREHPFYVLKRADYIFINNNVRRCFAEEDIDINKAQWVKSCDLEVGDALLVPVPLYEEHSEFIDPRLAKLFGYYLAEGHIRLTPNGEYCSVLFSTAKDDIINEQIIKLATDLGYKVAYKRVNQPNAACIVITDKQFASLCDRYCGRMSKGKRLDEEVLTWDLELQRHFLGAYLDGDGCFLDGKWQTGAAIISTANTYLRDQIIVMLNRIGCVCGYNTLKHKAGGGKNTRDTVEYQIYIPKSDTHCLYGYAQKISYKVETDRGRGGKKKKTENYILIPIDEINRSAPVSVEVFNLEVEEDNSFLISNNIAVHNSAQDYDVCSLCGHKAKFASDHDDHIKNHLREVADNGQKIYMQNPNPKYFDISLITNADGSPGRQADRIAFGLRKVASESEPTGLDLAAAYGLVEAGIGKLAAMQRLASLYKTLPVTLRKSTVPEIVRADTIDELKKQAQVYGMDQLLGYLVKHAFILAPTDFVRVFLNTQCEQLNAVDAESLGLDDLVKSAEEVQSFNLPISQDDLGLTPATYRDLHRSCSMDANSAYERALRNSMQPQVKIAAVADDVRGLQDLYRHYKLSYAERNINYNLVASF